MAPRKTPTTSPEPEAPVPGVPAGLANRVVRLEFIAGDRLQQNPQNFRRHPTFQRQVFRGLVDELGVADVLLVYDSERYGGLTLINGHMRTEELPGHEWPCVVTDLSDAEADVLLAAKDPLAALGHVDKATWRALRDAAIAPRDWKSDALSTFFKEEDIRYLGADLAAPSLADLQKRYGDHDETHFWPDLRLRRIEPEVYETFCRLLAECPGDTDSDRLAELSQRLLKTPADDEEVDD